MPTVVLIDRSLSMRRPASRNNPDQSRHLLACKGLECFFDYMEECFPLEYTSLVSFSSACDVLVPFTRNYTQLKEKLEDIPVLDRTDLHGALVAMVEIVMTEWGAFAPCQVVLVTDGLPGVRHQDLAHRRVTLNMPFPCQLHLVCVSTREELSRPPWQMRVQQLCDTTGITLAEVFVPSSPLSVETVQTTFRQLAKLHFRPYDCMLVCGHLQSRIGLSPSPLMHNSKFDLTVSAEHKFPKLEKSLGDLQYPQEIKLCGFLDTNCIPAPPLYARHFVLDPETDKRNLESKLVSVGRENGEKKHPSTSEVSQKPSFRVLLHGSLKRESKAALVKLGEGWYGLLFSLTSSSKKSNMILSVFYPNSDIPWLGPPVHLGPKPTHVDPRLPSDNKDPFPIPPPHGLSFQSPSGLLWANEAVLQTDVGKVIRYSRKLPEKEGSLVKELNKLRLVALTYNMPELTEVLCVVLSKEEASASTPQIKTLLQQCLLFLTSNKNPQERLVVTHK